MAEYIDREAANLALAEQGFDWDKAKQALASVPAADVAPVVHGRWIQVDSTKCRCSHCDIIALIALYPHGDKNFFPNCGATTRILVDSERVETNAVEDVIKAWNKRANNEI